MEDIYKKYEELRLYAEQLESRLQGLEKKQKAPDMFETPKNFEYEDIKRYDLLRVGKLMASLPIYTTSRQGKLLDGEIYLNNYSGARKLCIWITDTSYCFSST